MQKAKLRPYTIALWAILPSFVIAILPSSPLDPRSASIHLNYQTGHSFLQSEVFSGTFHNDDSYRNSVGFTISASARAYNKPAALRPVKNPSAKVERDRRSLTSTTPSRKGRRRKKWDKMVVRLEEYYARHKHSMVTRTEDAELYTWAQSLRKNYSHQIRYPDTVLPNRPRLSETDVQLLSSVEFCWNVMSASWDRRFEQLRSFYNEHGHCQVSMTDDVQLGNFVQNQRQEYRRLQQYGVECYKSTLTPDRIQKLNQLNFEWSRTHQVGWEKRFTELQQFIKLFGHADVPQDYDNNPTLGKWCMNQRTKYRQYQSGESNGLNEKQIRRLESIGFSWNTREVRWQTMLRRLQDYHKMHRHIDIPVSDLKNSDLRLWLIWQRFVYNSIQRDDASYYSLSQARIDQLEAAIPEFSWKARDSGAPTKEDWSQLFGAIQEKGIKPGMRPKQHWFEGMRPFQMDVKSEWTEDELVDLWNSGDEDDDDDDDDDHGDEYNGITNGDSNSHGFNGDDTDNVSFGVLRNVEGGSDDMLVVQ